MTCLPCDPKTIWLSVAGLAAYALLELWLGKTTRTKAGSLPEFIFLVIIAAVNIVIFFIKRRKQNG